MHINIHDHTKVKWGGGQTYKALCSVIHEAQLEPVLSLVALGHGTTQDVRRNG